MDDVVGKRRDRIGGAALAAVMTLGLTVAGPAVSRLLAQAAAPANPEVESRGASAPCGGEPLAITPCNGVITVAAGTTSVPVTFTVSVAGRPTTAARYRVACEYESPVRACRSATPSVERARGSREVRQTVTLTLAPERGVGRVRVTVFDAKTRASVTGSVTVMVTNP